MKRDQAVAAAAQIVGAQILTIGFLFHKFIFVIVIPDADRYLIVGYGIAVWVVMHTTTNLGVGGHFTARTVRLFFSELAEGKLGGTITADPIAIVIHHNEVRVGMMSRAMSGL